jgi:hypothetical protein
MGLDAGEVRGGRCFLRQVTLGKVGTHLNHGTLPSQSATRIDGILVSCFLKATLTVAAYIHSYAYSTDDHPAVIENPKLIQPPTKHPE